ncbi:MAG TPA: hypothetical protein VH877_27115 [Polyangia bacterium]|nr:hypothetical protein [Polyangia bacterium]
MTRALVVIGLGALLMAMAPAMPAESDAKAPFLASSAGSTDMGELAHSARSGSSALTDRSVRHFEPLRAVPPSGLSPTQPEKLL